MAGKTYQNLIHYSARCNSCHARCDKRNAQAWAHNHCRTSGHTVSLELAFSVQRGVVAAAGTPQQRMDL